MGLDLFMEKSIPSYKNISLPSRCTTGTRVAEVCYCGILIYNQKTNTTSISEEKQKLCTN
jgi:hypothetical protein